MSDGMPYATTDGLPADGFLETPEHVTPGGVTPGVTHSVTPAVTAGVTQVVPGAVEGERDVGVATAPLPAVGWAELPAEPDGGPGPAATAGPGFTRMLWELAGGDAGLAWVLANPPRAQTLRQHWSHVTGHEMREGPFLWRAGFTIGHFVLTVPVKLAGKTLHFTGAAADRYLRMHKAGTVLMRAGDVLDWGSDRFVRIAVPLALLIFAAVVIVYG